MERIGVFCSASAHVAPHYLAHATELGQWLGKHKKTLVYGGSNQGLMGAIAQAAKKNGATIIGMVPTRLEELNMESHDLDVIFRTDNLSDRKDLMLQESDILVALPGGIGTMDEIFTVMASASIGYHRKMIILYNQDGFWSPLIQFLNQIESAQFAHSPLNNYYRVANTLDELYAELQSK